MIISQTKTFDIFPGSIQVSAISKILTTNCKRYTYQYIPTRELWLNRLYFGYKKYKLFDVTKFILVLPTFRLKQQSLSRTRC